jgi:hypothetical protein
VNRVAYVAVEAVNATVNATVRHLRRIVAVLCTALGRTRREVRELAWDYQDLAASVRVSGRRRRVPTSDDGQAMQGQQMAEVISIDLRRRKAN